MLHDCSLYMFLCMQYSLFLKSPAIILKIPYLSFKTQTSNVLSFLKFPLKNTHPQFLKQSELAASSLGLNSVYLLLCCSVTQSCLTLQPHGLQHARPPCPSPSPEVCPSSCSLHQWCHPALWSFDALFSFCLQPFSASETIPMRHLFASDEQNTWVSGLALVPLVNIQG